MSRIMRNNIDIKYNIYVSNNIYHRYVYKKIREIMQMLNKPERIHEKRVRMNIFKVRLVRNKPEFWR